MIWRAIAAVTVVGILTAAIWSQTQNAQPPQGQPAQGPRMNTMQEKASYLVGYEFFQNFKVQEIELSMDHLIQGMRDAAASRQPPMDQEEIESVLAAFQRHVQERQQQWFARLADQNQRQGEAFLRENANREGVRQLESGLQYLVMRTATGPSPEVSDRVRVHYKGSFTDGTVFESSYESEPQEFVVGGVIQGMTQALQRMSVGEKWQIFIPSRLAYGPDGAPPVIGPNQTLVFEVELLEILR